MNHKNIEINTQSSIKIMLDTVLYFDPYNIENDIHDADIIFITHAHSDHLDIESIKKVKKENTIVVAPKSMKNIISNIIFKDYIYLNPNDEILIEGINIKTIPAYNIEKPFHPITNNWLGYIITYNNITYYIAGDTDKTKESENVKCDIALIPIGGYYTMNVNEASELVKIINPSIVIPTHYGSIVGSINDGKLLEQQLSNTDIQVIEKIKF